MERTKWKTIRRNLVKGDRVLLVEKNTPRGHWATGIVGRTYPGVDSLVRVVDVRIGETVCQKAIHTLILISPVKKETALEKRET